MKKACSLVLSLSICCFLSFCFFFFLCCAPFGRGYRVEQKGYSVLHLATMRNQGAMGEDSVGVDARADLMAVVRTPTLP